MAFRQPAPSWSAPVSLGAPGRAAPWLALAASALSWALSSAPTELQVACALKPSAIADGELWRLWTGHFVHFGGPHLRGDLLAFLVWAAWLEHGARSLLFRLLLIGTPLLSLLLLIGCPTLGEYRGLSGLDCSLVGALIWLRGLQSERLRGVGMLCLTAFVAKCGYELLVGRAILAPDLGEGVRLLPLAHVMGAAVGVLLASQCLARARTRLAQLD
jgi:rhomboid family GlyGly-CTERM serine protease